MNFFIIASSSRLLKFYTRMQNVRNIPTYVKGDIHTFCSSALFDWSNR